MNLKLATHNGFITVTRPAGIGGKSTEGHRTFRIRTARAGAAHEASEARKMAHGLPFYQAHKHANRIERNLGLISADDIGK